jgi:hypothetical protein
MYLESSTATTQKERPTMEMVYNKVLTIKNISYDLPKTRNKGKPGQFLEQLTGIPTSSECLDCLDGEVKVFPVKKLKKTNQFSPKETIAVTMINEADLQIQEFEQSRCYKKLSNVLYIPYYREGNKITFLNPTLVNMTSREPMRNQLKEDYENIRTFYKTNQTLQTSSTIGTYMQNRTKGAGKEAPKTRAFYLRPKFMKDFVEMIA